VVRNVGIRPHDYGEHKTLNCRSGKGCSCEIGSAALCKSATHHLYEMFSAYGPRFDPGPRIKINITLHVPYHRQSFLLKAVASLSSFRRRGCHICNDVTSGSVFALPRLMEGREEYTITGPDATPPNNNNSVALVRERTVAKCQLLRIEGATWSA
jgi:hypothetical protein